MVVVLIAVVSLGFVREKQQVHTLGQQIKQRELMLKNLEEQNARLQKQLAILRSPIVLQMRANQLNLGLVQTQPKQVIQLVDNNWGFYEPTTLFGLDSNKLVGNLGFNQAHK